jgi:hypothetical protein
VDVGVRARQAEGEARAEAQGDEREEEEAGVGRRGVKVSEGKEQRPRARGYEQPEEGARE